MFNTQTTMQLKMWISGFAITILFNAVSGNQFIKNDQKTNTIKQQCRTSSKVKPNIANQVDQGFFDNPEVFHDRYTNAYLQCVLEKSSSGKSEPNLQNLKNVFNLQESVGEKDVKQCWDRTHSKNNGALEFGKCLGLVGKNNPNNAANEKGNDANGNGKQQESNGNSDKQNNGKKMETDDKSKENSVVNITISKEDNQNITSDPAVLVKEYGKNENETSVKANNNNSEKSENSEDHSGSENRDEKVSKQSIDSKQATNTSMQEQSMNITEEGISGEKNKKN